MRRTSDHIPQRTCTGCKVVAAQRELVRVAVDGTRIVLDPKRRLAGRGAWVHPRASCVTIPGLARALKRSVTKADVDRIVASLSDMSAAGDNCHPPQVKSVDQVEGSDDPSENDPGLGVAITVETTPRIKAKDERTEDARV